MAILYDSLITPPGVIQVMVDFVDVPVDQYQELRPDRFFEAAYASRTPAIHLGVNQINGQSPFSFRSGVKIRCLPRKALASFVLGGS